MIDRPVMILAGGTGGHVFPALAVAECLREQTVPVLWVGTRGGLEESVVPRAGFPITFLPLRAPRRRGIVGLLTVAPRVLWCILMGFWLLFRQRPAVVLGMGGYASSAVAVAAVMGGVPLVIHEQNAIAGLTNRWLARRAVRVLKGFQTVQGLAGGMHCGNPVRFSLCAQPLDAAAPGRRMRLLVVGGSQGAATFNDVVPQALDMMADEECPEIWHQTGSDPEPVQARYQAACVHRVEAFITEMEDAYLWADLVLARAGAMTLAELASSARGAILVPYPHAADGHQQANAEQYAADGAAEVWTQREFTANRLAARLSELSRDRPRLAERSRAALRNACPEAARMVADTLLEYRS